MDFTLSIIAKNTMYKIYFYRIIDLLSIRKTKKIKKIPAYLLRGVNLRTLILLQSIVYKIKITKRQYHVRKISNENLSKIVPCSVKNPHYQMTVIKSAIENGLMSQNTNLLNMLNECSDGLRTVSDDIKQDGFSPLFVPMHFCSDKLAVIAAAMASSCETFAYSIYGVDDLGINETEAQEAQGVNIVQISPNAPSSQQKEIIRKAKAGESVIVIFPDITPQCTRMKFGKKMSCRNTFLFGKNAVMHDGYATIARLTRSKIINYYMYYDNGVIKIKIFKPASNFDEVKCNFETALKEKPEQWLLWHYTTFFYHNS